MRKASGCGWMAVAAVLAACGTGPEPPGALRRAPLPASRVDGVVFEAGDWEPLLPPGQAGASWGNHRAVVEVDPGTGAEAVAVTIPWRRPDPDPAKKGVIVVDAATGEPVANALALRVENASGDVVFQPNPGSAVYYVYYFPWQSSGGYYPTVTYPTPEELAALSVAAPSERESPSRAQGRGPEQISWTGLVSVNDPEWVAEVSRRPLSDLPRARATRIQSLDAFHSFFPMEVIATPEETEAFLAVREGGWAAVPEYRDFPVRMRRFLPVHWVRATDGPDSGETGFARRVGRRGPDGRSVSGLLSSPVLRDEAFTFQVALVAGGAPLEDVRVSLEGFPDTWLETFTCFNCGGVDEKGERFSRPISVPEGGVQPLWLGVMVPPDQGPGVVEGAVIVSTRSRGSKRLRVALDVQAGRATNHGFDEPDLMTRLFWLNSTLGADPDYVMAPFEPVAVEGRRVSVLGRAVELAESGFPSRIVSYFTPELTSLSRDPAPVLARPITFEVIAGGRPERFEPAPFEVRAVARGRAEWTVESASEAFGLRVEGAIEYDGMLDYRIRLIPLREVAVEDIALSIPLVPGAAEYMLGLGRPGGRRPPRVDWKWSIEKHQEGAWLGAVNRGLQYVLRDENYVRPLNTNFYRNQPLRMPPSWFNEGRGGIRIVEEREENAPQGEVLAVTARNYSGPRRLAAGDTLHFNVRFLVTPFKPIVPATHFRTRFVHKYVPVDSVRAWGGTVVNIHHANEINPYINYPFFNLGEQAAYIEEAHRKGVKVKLYYTIRELTYKAYELFALRSLGDEILNDGEGGGHSWLQEHLRGDYHAGWHAWRVDDAAVLDKGTSRWTNYYVEGLAWLAEHQGIDGLYVDDIAFSRETVKRMATVLEQRRPGWLIDLHSANQFNVRDGFINSAMLYMEHFPYISRLWFGEYFDYGRDPDYWMTEVSGLPFGLMGEMLQGGGHPYRGLLYGMTTRLYGDTDPRPVWRMMEAFGIADSRMLGYWLPDAPVRTNRPDVLATTYVRSGRALIVLGSWSGEAETVRLSVDWEALGWGEGGEGLRAYAPAVEGLQAEADVDLSAVRVPAGQGLFVVVEAPESEGGL